MRVWIKLLIAFAAAVAASPGYAQIYKWVDERGVVNYSSEPPADRGIAKDLRVVENNISVYSPDATLLQAVEAARRGVNPIARTETPAYAAAPQAPQFSAPPYPTGSDPCAGERAIYCYGSYSPYPYPGAYFPPHTRARNIPQVRLVPGTIAGHAVGPEGFIPGNSAAAAGRFSPRSLDWFSTTGGFTRR